MKSHNNMETGYINEGECRPARLRVLFLLAKSKQRRFTSIFDAGEKLQSFRAAEGRDN